MNKGTGLESLCQALGVPIERAIAFGDADNDLEMLQIAGQSICVAQGTSGAKEAAKKVSEFTNDQHAVAKELSLLRTSEQFSTPSQDASLS